MTATYTVYDTEELEDEEDRALARGVALARLTTPRRFGHALVALVLR